MSRYGESFRPPGGHHHHYYDDVGGRQTQQQQAPARRSSHAAAARIALALGAVSLAVAVVGLVLGAVAVHRTRSDAAAAAVGDAMRWWSPVASVNGTASLRNGVAGQQAALALGAALVTPSGDGTRGDAPSCGDSPPRAMVDAGGTQRAALIVRNNILADRLQFCMAAGTGGSVLSYRIAVEAVCVDLPRDVLTACADTSAYPFTGSATGASTVCHQTPMADTTDGFACASVSAVVTDGSATYTVNAVGSTFCDEAPEMTFPYAVRSCDSVGDARGDSSRRAWWVAAFSTAACLLAFGAL